MGSDPHGDGVVISCPAPEVAMASGRVSLSPRLHSASPFSTHEVVQGNSWGQTKQLSSAGADIISPFFMKRCWASNSADLLFSVCRNHCSVNYKALGYHYFLQSIRLSPPPSQLSVCRTAASQLQEPSGSRTHLLGFSVMFLVCVVQYDFQC